jgi:hypothetical protein
MPYQSSESVPVHVNIPQLKMELVGAQYMIAEWSRRSGKTEGVVAPRVCHCAFELPRSLGGMVAPSYRKFLTQFVPSLLTGFEKYGYVEGRDFTIGSSGPKSWALPVHRPKDWSHALHWRCGSAEVFISQDRPGSANGLTLDRGVIDEAKLINEEQLEDEFMPAMSGHPMYFGGRAEHKSLLITSDKSRYAKGRWFKKYKAKMEPAVIDGIFQVQIEIMLLKQAIAAGHLSERSVAQYRSEIRQWEKDLNELRIGTTYYLEASALDNIDALGVDYLMEMKRSMSDIAFRLSILNEDVDKVEGGFYPDLSERHEYTPIVTSFTTERGYDRDRLQSRDCRHDSHIIPTLPLEIGMDYGKSFNCMAVAQYFDRELRFDNGLHRYNPDMTVHVLQDFVRYYGPHKNKTAVYYFDHTALQGTGLSEFSYKDIVINTLSEAGWEVVPVFIGHTPSPALRYEMYGAYLREDSPELIRLRWNNENCQDMLTSMHMTDVREGKNGFEKQKNPERDQNLDQAHAPHYGDACDQVVWGRTQVANARMNMPTAGLLM